LTSEQLEAARAERMRQNGHGAITLEDARTWMEETGLCLFLPKRQFSSSLAPSFVEAVIGRPTATPDPAQIAVAEDLLVRLERDGVAVRLNLLGQPGEHPDYVVASWVLPYVYALRGDRDWRRSPQLTGSRQVSPLAIQAYKRLEAGDSTIAELTRALGREVSEMAVLRAITELWQQLRIIPVIAAPGQAAQWQLLRHRFQKAIAEGASTSQVTAISVLASIYLQAVIAASMEEVEIFLSPLTARSKIREVIRGLVATRQVHTLTLGHAPHYYVAGTLPEFAPTSSVYASSAMSGTGYFARFHDHDDSYPEPEPVHPMRVHETAEPKEASTFQPEAVPVPTPVAHSSNGNAKSAARAHRSRPAPHARDRKISQGSGNGRSARRTQEGRSSSARAGNGSRSAGNDRWGSNAPKSNGPLGGSRNGNGHPGKQVSSSWGKLNGNNGNSGSANGTKAGSATRTGGLTRNGSATRTESRNDVRNARSGRKPALTAGTKAGNTKRFGFTARPKQGTKKRG
jgi:23S rRNA pseudouridine2605 synthase